MSESSQTAPPAAAGPAGAESPHALRWIPIAHGAINIVFGGLLIFTPGRTLVFVATLAGISLLVVALIDFLAALAPGLNGARRAAGFGIALLAAAAGVIVIARPEGSIKTIAVIAGIYLVVMGVTTMVLGSPGTGRGAALLRGALAVVAGIALLVWPDVSVGVVAAVYGAFLLALGVAELLFGIRMGRAHDTT